MNPGRRRVAGSESPRERSPHAIVHRWPPRGGDRDPGGGLAPAANQESDDDCRDYDDGNHQQSGREEGEPASGR